MKTASTKDGLWGMWRDLTEEPAWKYEEVPPLLLAELTELDLFEVGDTELARVHWFWSRRPKLAVHESAVLLVVALCVLLSLALAFVARPGTSMPERVAEMVILLLELALGIYLSVFLMRRSAHGLAPFFELIALTSLEQIPTQTLGIFQQRYVK